ncbi:MAG: translation initiation factor IF-2 [Nitrospirae bacterium]|nr:translation initiation factor IF-2 [Nitrospirota bacterium]
MEIMNVSDLAKKMKIATKDLLAELKVLGSRASSPSATVEESAVKQIIEKYKKAAPVAKTVKKAAEAPVKTKSQKAVSVEKSAKKAVPVKKAVKPAIKTVKLKKAEPIPQPEPEKKTRILIKKKAEPEPVVTVSTPHAASPSSDLQTLSGSSTATIQPSEPSAHPTSVSEAAPHAVSEGTPPAIPASPSAAAPASMAAPVKPKLLKTDLFELAKQELSDRLKQRGKKVRKTKKSKENPLEEYQYELSSWRDIRPSTHREERHKRSAAPAGVVEITKPRRKIIKLSEGLTVKEFAELIGQKTTEVIRKLVEMGTMATINQPMDLAAGVLIAENHGLKAEIVHGQTEEDMLSEERTSEAGDLRPRPPVVTIMGHVDHGKTSLLDAIRSTKVAAGEAGGITQHIGAYTVKVGDRTVTFLDTPGHEAFTAMRARGAKVTDIVVLVVAADDGVMPQTIEAINHARAANVPIIVAINKIDKPEANPERVKSALAEQNLLSEAWGGQSIFVEVSAKKRLNLESLLEMILLQADVLELKADPSRLAKGIVIEAKMDKGRGPVATVLVQSGTLNVGDAFVTGSFFGRVRALINDEGKKVESARPSQPVEVIGLPGVPQAGDSFAAVREERVAREIATSRMQKERTAKLAQQRRVTLEDLYTQIKEGTVKELNLILKTDVQGSAEALMESLNKLSTPAVKLNVIHSGAGGITETDVLLASASNAIVIGFNVRPEAKAAALAEREKVDIRSYNVIYDAIGDIRAAMEGLLEPTLKERVTGRCEVRQVFNISKVGTIAGAYVTDGMISRAGTGVRLLRDSVVVYTGKLSSLKRFKDDVREVQAGYECGIGIENYNDLKVGDVIEAFVVDKIAAKL